MTNKEKDEKFKSVKITEYQKMAQVTMDINARNLLYVIDSEVPDSREKSIAITKLEEVVMWANKAISRNSKFFE